MGRLPTSSSSTPTRPDSTRTTSGPPLLGPDIIPHAFRWAHEADPNALLFYNDYNIGGEDGTNAKSDAVYAFVQQMLKDGVPIDGVGNQGHLDTQYGWTRSCWPADLQRYADLGLKVAITEADVRTFVNNADRPGADRQPGPFAQPYEYSEMLKAALSVPQCISFTVWGFSDSDSWVPGTFAGEGYAAIYDVNLNPKPPTTPSSPTCARRLRCARTASAPTSPAPDGDRPGRPSPSSVKPRVRSRRTDLPAVNGPWRALSALGRETMPALPVPFLGGILIAERFRGRCRRAVGSGKSSASKGVARELGLRYLDTGAMYRALTWWFMTENADTADTG